MCKQTQLLSIQILHLQVRTAYKTYMKTIAKLLGGGPSSDYKMDAIYDFERSIAEVCYCLNCR